MKNSSALKILMKVYMLCRHNKLCVERETEKTRFDTAILMALGEGSKTIRQLCVLFSVNHSLMSDKISSMKKRGLVKKEIAKDQRYRSIKLDKKGEAMLNEVNSTMSDYADDVFSKLSKSELSQFDRLFAKVTI